MTTHLSSPLQPGNPTSVATTLNTLIPPSRLADFSNRLSPLWKKDTGQGTHIIPSALRWSRGSQGTSGWGENNRIPKTTRMKGTDRTQRALASSHPTTSPAPTPLPTSSFHPTCHPSSGFAGSPGDCVQRLHLLPQCFFGKSSCHHGHGLKEEGSHLGLGPSSAPLHP